MSETNEEPASAPPPDSADSPSARPVSRTRVLTREIDAAYEALKELEHEHASVHSETHEAYETHEVHKVEQDAAETRLYGACTQLARILIGQFYGTREVALECDIATKVLSRRAQFRGASRFSTWVFKLAKNECGMALRAVTADRRMVRITFERNKEDRDTDWAKVPEGLKVPPPQSTAHLDLDNLKQGLPEEQLRVVNLRLRGYTLGEISEQTGAPPGTTASRWRLAMDKLRGKLLKLKELRGRKIPPEG
jgi:RNA polymerase sigma factor (sigma-70 family)